MKWTTQYSVGYDTMDEQHRIIFDLINDLFDCIRSGNPADASAMMTRLDDFVVRHFAEEEELLEATSHPDLEWQRREHGEFLDGFRHFRGKVQREDTATFEIELSRFLMHWWNKHILESDKRYAR